LREAKGATDSQRPFDTHTVAKKKIHVDISRAKTSTNSLFFFVFRRTPRIEFRKEKSTDSEFALVRLCTHCAIKKNSHLFLTSRFPKSKFSAHTGRYQRAEFWIRLDARQQAAQSARRGRHPSAGTSRTATPIDASWCTSCLSDSTLCSTARTSAEPPFVATAKTLRHFF
jgi:hypothetical protein